MSIYDSNVFVYHADGEERSRRRSTVHVFVINIYLFFEIFPFRIFRRFRPDQRRARRFRSEKKDRQQNRTASYRDRADFGSPREPTVHSQWPTLHLSDSFRSWRTAVCSS